MDILLNKKILINVPFDAKRNKFKEAKGYRFVNEHLNNILDSKTPIRIKDLDDMFYTGSEDSKIWGCVVSQPMMNGVKVTHYNGSQYYIPDVIEGDVDSTLPIYIKEWNLGTNYFDIVGPPAIGSLNTELKDSLTFPTKDFDIIVGKLDNRDFIMLNSHIEHNKFLLQVDIAKAKELKVQEWDKIIKWHSSLELDFIDSAYMSEIIIGLEFFKYL